MSADDTEDVRPHGLSDDAIAQRFTDRHGDELRYCAEQAAWYRYEAGRWRKDNTLHVFDLVRWVCRDAQDDPAAFGHLPPAKRERLIAELRSARTIAAAERVARSDPRTAIAADQLDAHDWLLNTPGGEVDLRTGVLHPHQPGHLHTKQTAVLPHSEFGCPTWRRFLERVTGGDHEMVAYLQRVCGYALAGVTVEHVMLFLWGRGANGKSTFSSTVAGILGDYATVAPMETFVEQPGQSHPTELALLAGARLVTATETDPGRRWALGRIKALTGGDRVTARFMRADFFSFTPRFLLILSGNHRPSLGAVDEAMRRRLHLVPFTAVIPPAERDPELPDKLRREWPAILAWMVEGCLAWQREGLKPPAAVTAASAEYMERQDTLGLWLEAATAADLVADVPIADLFADYRGWCLHVGERPMSERALSDALADRGYARHRTSRARVVRGLRLLPVADRPWWTGAERRRADP